MKASTTVRILHDALSAGPRQTYWSARALLSELARLGRARNHAFRRHAVRDLTRYWTAVPQAPRDDIRARADAAVAWLSRAQLATPDDGVSLGWFPCANESGGWKPSYPETTGYIITSLLAYARAFNEPDAREAALRMSRWEIGVQMPSGAVQGGPVTAPERQTPAAFNTGMVLDGWCSVLAEQRDAATYAAAQRAADFLAQDVDVNGYFRTNGAFVTSGEIKTYACLCAWAMHRFANLTGESRYAHAAINVIEAAVRQQRPNGWFEHNCLVRSDAPLTHTIGYTLQGVLEVGAMAARDDFVAAVRLAIDNVIPRIRSDGYLSGMFYANWEPAAFSSCLTGSAQIAIVCYRFSELTGEARYRNAADALLEHLKSLQDLTTSIDEARGALPGSFPLFGNYMRGGYPNWATKYLLDALLLQQRANASRENTSSR